MIKLRKIKKVHNELLKILIDYHDRNLMKIYVYCIVLRILLFVGFLFDVYFLNDDERDWNEDTNINDNTTNINDIKRNSCV